jgi:hypothetical protein
VRCVIFCLSIAVSSTGCIYDEMNDTNSFETNSACAQLVTSVCRDCSYDLCELYEMAVYTESLSEEECAREYDSLLESGC